MAKPPEALSREGELAQQGQIIVLFALSLVAVIGMVGLVIDGGGAFAQRRDEQNVADFASVAGANAYMNTDSTVAARTAAAIVAATASATQNGYTHGLGATAVNVNVTLLSAGARVEVGVTRPHDNSFARIMGQNQWPVSVRAAADAGTIDTGVGAAPWTMSILAFNADGTPRYDVHHPIAFGSSCGDYAAAADDLAWTDYNGFNNVNSNEVRRIMDGSNVITATMNFGQYVGQHNNGCHTTLFDEVQQDLAGRDLPVPITGPGPCDPNGQLDGCFKGWAMFHITSADGGSTKAITGYFLDDFVSQPLTVGECTAAMAAAGVCGVIDLSALGGYVVRLSQ
jgi:putative Flp pilus-assembly TadE/G-like protein